ncbi:Ltp family lipoprotein [Streptococcus australis]|uniref:Ltp family lipoprotein n=2 Tax=Streptococcus australis TaxID=113107 RepID=UPI0031B5720C
MKYSIGEKQVKVFIMKKFLIVIFAMVGMMVIWIAFMVYSYQRSYNEWQNSHSGSKVTYPVQEYSSSNSSTKYYDYKNSNKSTDAYVKALFLSENSHLSKQKIEQDLTRWYSEDACQYAMNKLNIDWKEQAVLKAKSLQMFHFSKEMLVSQLINVELFTQEEADYAIEQVNFDWKEEAVKKVEAIANPGNMSKEELLELLVKKRKFTQEEAEYAIEHAQVDWLN